jgi:glycosyltransferase involved in cell wall biosynthesis
MKICYFGIYNPEFGRNKVYISGLRALGHEVIECRDSSPGFLKYARLRRTHRAIMKAGGYDAMVVGYPGHVMVPFAKRISHRPVVFDALCTLYEGEVLSRKVMNPLKRWKIGYIDEKAALAADLILVETEAQKAFFARRFPIDPAKISRVWTGVDETSFNQAMGRAATKRSRFTAVFRGKFLPEAGVQHVIDAAKLLQGEGVDFLILGHGFLEKDIEAHIRRVRPANLEWISDWLPSDDIARRMAECHVSLGQLARHERLERTVPHKAFESLALGLPYVTARAAGISELLTDGTDCLMVEPGDAEDLAAKILRLKNQPDLMKSLGENGSRLFREKLSSVVLARGIVAAIEPFIR